MAVDSEAVVLYFCANHMEVDLSQPYPEHVFGCYPVNVARKCRFDGCLDRVVIRFIGYKTPNTVGDLKDFGPARTKVYMNEIFADAAEELTKLPAKEALETFLFFRIRVEPLGGDGPSMAMCSSLARLVLKELKINSQDYLLDIEVHRILKLLNLYPADYEES